LILKINIDVGSMKNGLILLAIIALVVMPRLATAQGWQWALCPNDTFESRSVAMGTDRSGNVYLLGDRDSTITFGSTTLHNTAQRTIFLAKFDSAGNFIWAKEIYGRGGLDPVMGAASLSVDSIGNVCIIGFFSYDTIVLGATKLGYNGGFGGCNGFLAKYDPSGNMSWATTLDGQGGSVDPSGVSIGPSGDIFVSGTYFPGGSLSAPSYFTCDTITLTYSWTFNDIFAIKYNSSGRAVWVRTASAFDCRAYASCTDLWGNLYVAGMFVDANVTFGTTTLANTGFAHPGDDMFLVKYDPLGNVLWAQVAGYDTFATSPSSITTDRYGGIYIEGHWYGDSVQFGSIAFSRSRSLTQPWSEFLAKYDSLGNALWADSVNNANAINGYVAADDSANIYVTGSDTVGNLYIEKYDSTGGVKWIAGANVGNSCYPSAVSTGPAGTVYVTGYFFDAIRFGSINLVDDIPISNPYDPGKLFLAKMECRLRDNIIYDPGQEKLSIRPNPTANYIDIDFENKKTTLEIYDVYGRRVYNQTVTAQKMHLDVSRLSSGTYVIKADNSYLGKFVKI
jgi:hypothetical protein